MNLKSSISEFFITGNVFVALCAASLTLQTTVRIQLENKFLIPLLVFGSTLLAYNLHRLVKKRFQGNPFSNNSKILYLFLGAVISAYGLINVSTEVIYAYILIGLPTVFYTFKLVGTGKKRKSLRHIPYVKPILIAFVWTSISVSIPYLSSNSDLRGSWMFFLERFLFVIAITIPFDIRDVIQDMEDGITTFPNKLGIEFTKALSLITLSFFWIWVVLEFWLGIINPGVLIALSLSAISTFLLIYNIRNSSRSNYYTIYLEGTSLFQSMMVLFFIGL